MKNTLVVIGLSLVASTAVAHVDIVSGLGFADTTQEIAFSVGHGCSGADTYAVTIDIPSAVTSVRPANSDLGKASVAKDPAGIVTSVTWQKAEADLLDADDNYYKLVLRLKVPNQPFTSLPFIVHQTCKTKAGATATTHWAVTDNSTEGEPAPKLRIVPARQPGWNKITIPATIDDLATYFKDAQIVWRGDSAYSNNTTTAEQIAATAGVSTLTTLQANDEVWVKY